VNSLEGGPYLGVDEVAELLVVSQWTIYDRSRRGAIPHRKPPGSRKLLFLVEEIRAWVDGAELESTTPPAVVVSAGWWSPGDGRALQQKEDP
jgi:excisionase family DNA binding protein